MSMMIIATHLWVWYELLRQALCQALHKRYFNGFSLQQPDGVAIDVTLFRMGKRSLGEVK